MRFVRKGMAGLLADFADHITKLIEPLVTDLGFELIRVSYGGGRRSTLQVMAERPDGTMTVDDCAKLSREVSALLDVEDPIDDEFYLEVSSPGVDRPLTRLKDFDRWQGFEGKVELHDQVDGRRRFKGMLTGVTDDQVLMEVDGEAVAFQFDDIHKAKLVLTDALLDHMAAQRKASEQEEQAHG